MLLSPYYVNNLLRVSESLLEISRTLNSEISALQSLKDDVKQQQQETHRQSQMVKRMTDYLSDELGRLETDEKFHSISITKNLDKLSETETRLRILRGRLDEFVQSDDAESLKQSDFTLAGDLKKYESFLLDLTGLLNEKIPQMEKIVHRINGEGREAQQQKLLLKEMADLFNSELQELDLAFSELRGDNSIIKQRNYDNMSI